MSIFDHLKVSMINASTKNMEKHLLRTKRNSEAGTKGLQLIKKPNYYLKL